MPLIIGMVVCLLVLGAGVTAATSAFLARSRLQHSCDGAAATASDAARRSAALTGRVDADSAAAAAWDYVRQHDPRADLALRAEADGVELTCSSRSAVTFGALFATPEISLTVQASGRSVLP